jgi:hypothetical protein
MLGWAIFFLFATLLLAFNAGVMVSEMMGAKLRDEDPCLVTVILAFIFSVMMILSAVATIAFMAKAVSIAGGALNAHL